MLMEKTDAVLVIAAMFAVTDEASSYPPDLPTTYLLA
jgi:hypothetical protein